MNVLFIGQFYPKRILETIQEDTYGKVGFSNHNFEIALIRGFASRRDIRLRTVSLPSTFSYPQNNRNIYIKSERYIADGISVSSAGFFNLFGINLPVRIAALTHRIISELNRFEDDNIYIIVNTPNIMLTQSLYFASKISKKHISTSLIVPDIPELLNTMFSGNRIKHKIITVLNKYNSKLTQKYDKYIFLTREMNDFYQLPEHKFMIMEGLIDESRVKSQHESKISQKEIILYAGSLAKVFGIQNLLQVFNTANIKNAELWLCGTGDAIEDIKQAAKLNSNIKYLGLVSPERAIELQAQATILVNPRTSKNLYTKYSFPSKTLEYLLAGKTVLMNHLPGIPTEYDSYLFYPDNESIDAWCAKLHEICSMNIYEREKIAASGRIFILEHKTATSQCRRIIDFISR